LFRAYTDLKKDYKKNTYKISRELFEEMKEESSFTMQKLGYELPGEVELIDA
jgi:hypothetical protein